MSEVVGTWQNLTEAQKLVTSELLSGIIDTVMESGGLIPFLPIKLIRGKSLLYNREVASDADSGADFFDIHEQIPWTADEEEDQIETFLKRVARQQTLDNFIRITYAKENDYQALMIAKAAKKLARFINDKLWYGDKDNVSTKEFDGLHALAAELSGDNNIDQGQGALSLQNLRKLLDAVKIDAAQLGKDNVAIFMPRALARRIDAAYQEGGFVRSSVTHSLGSINLNGVDIGGRVNLFDGVPIIRSDFLVAEEFDTGLISSSAREKFSSGTRMYSIFVVRFGQTEDGGVSMLVGDSEASDGEFVFARRTSFEKLEDFDAGGERVVAYVAPALGSPVSLARITDITDAEIIP